MNCNENSPNKSNGVSQSAAKAQRQQTKVLQETTNEVDDPVPAAARCVSAATDQRDFKPVADPTEEKKIENDSFARSALATEYEEPPFGYRRCCRRFRVHLPSSYWKKKRRLKKEVDSKDPPPGSLWNIEDEQLPEPLTYDKFEQWPDGDIQKIYPDYEIRIKGFDNGWVMQDISVDNPNIMSKSCMGVLICSASCISAEGITVYKPAICDKHRKRQIGMNCSTPGCKGKLIHMLCEGHNGSPVIQLWRYYKNRVYFQSKGRHNHARPERKAPLSPMSKDVLSVGAQPSILLSPLPSVSTVTGDINSIMAIVNQLQQPRSVIFCSNPTHSPPLGVNLIPQSNVTNVPVIQSTPESFRASKSSDNALSQPIVGELPRTSSLQDSIIHEYSTPLMSSKSTTGLGNEASSESLLKRRQNESTKTVDDNADQPVQGGCEVQKAMRFSGGNDVVETSISSISRIHHENSSPFVVSIPQQASNSQVTLLHPFMIEMLLRVPFESKTTERSTTDPSIE